MVFEDILTRFSISKQTLKQLIRYLTIGVLSAGLDTLLFFLFKEFVFGESVKVHILKFWSTTVDSVYLSKSFAFLIVFWFNFIMNRIWSFQSVANLGRQVVLYAVLCGINWSISLGIIHLLTVVLGIYYMVANIFCVGVVAVWNFVIYKKIIYR